jgi:large subunit ribosomal protein L32e
VAVGQTVTKTSSPLVVLNVAREGKEIWNTISTLIDEWKPDQLLVGKPLNMDGTPSEMMKKVDPFFKKLPKQKPVLSDEMKIALALRVEQKKKTPAFKRTEWFRYKRLSRSGWRAPHGMDNKQRRNYKYRSSLVRVGHGKVAAARGLHPSGFREVMVHNTGDLEVIDPETEAARVGKTVGGRKREQIYSRADELGIRVLNRRRDV